MKLHISHVTQYDYEQPVTHSVNEIRLTPSTDDRQSCYQQAIWIEPNASLFSYEDFFGNRVHSFSVNPAHVRLTIRTQMTVVTKNTPDLAEQAAHLDSDSVREMWSYLQTDAALNHYAEFLLPTEYTRMTPEVYDYAHSIAQRKPQAANGSVADWLIALSDQIRTEMVYDPQATTVNTTASDMIKYKRGVCQDFAHLMIACCRSMRIPARYVSGYHFVGDLQGGSSDFEQASHAWVEAFVPAIGWCSLDPTNAASVGERYVKLGHGRDYKDIVPVKGIYQGNGEQWLKVTVDVRKVDQ